MVKPIDIYKYVEKFCKPVNVKMVNKDEGESMEGAEKQIQLHLVFEDVNSAIYAIYKCHNKYVLDSKIDIRFF